MLLHAALERLCTLDADASHDLGEDFYVWKLSHNPNASYHTAKEPVQSFVSDVRESFRLEKKRHAQLVCENLTDFIICGGGYEGHKIMKEVNFSDTYIKADGLCRIPGTYRGKAFSTVHSHGWFSCEVKVKPNATNTLIISAAGSDGHIDFDVTIGSDQREIRCIADGRRDFTFTFDADGQDTIRVRIDRVTGYTPFIYEIRIV